MAETGGGPGGAGDGVFVHVGDRVVPAAEASVPILDHGFLFGDSVYEVVRTANGRPFMLAEHLERMRRSGAMLYFDLPWSDDDIARRLEQVRERVAARETYFRIVATRGVGPISLLPDGCEAPGLFVIGRALIENPRHLYERGCRVVVVPRLRMHPRALDPRAKTGNYLNNMLGLVEAHRCGADDALFLNADGNLTEASTANLWIVEHGHVVTPPIAEGLLQGITRGWLLETLPAAGLAVEEDVVDPARLARAEEVFLSGTVKGVMPVTRVGDRVVGDGRPGPITRRAAALYDQALAAN